MRDLRSPWAGFETVWCAIDRRGVQVDPSVPGMLVERAPEDAVVVARMDVRGYALAILNC